MRKPILALIVPCYNEENILAESHNVFYNILKASKQKNIIDEDSYICYVNDGSRDKTWDIIKDFHSKYSDVKGLSLSRNFGLQGALTAGLFSCSADIYITIDCDLQEDPNIIFELINEYHNGNEIVYAVRNNRSGDGWFRTFAGNTFYKIMDLLGTDTIKNQSEVRLISSKVVKILKETDEKNVYLRGMIASVGFKNTKVFYNRTARIGGTSKWSFLKLFDTALDGMTTTTMKLLLYILLGGIFLFGISLLVLILFIITSIVYVKIHWYLLIIFTILFTGSILITSLGIIGNYIGKIYKEVRNRPSYIIGEDLTK